MTGFSVPKTLAENTAAFADSRSATRWLTGQPQANAPVMLAELAAQIQALNRYSMTPRERFKTLEVLRKSVFSASGDCQRRYENKPLPLLPAEQAALDLTLRLWRACAIGYLHCLRACLESDSAIDSESAKVAHRVLSCLRQEQLNCYLAYNGLAADFWTLLHSVLASAEQLGVAREPVADAQLGETSESTVGGQYSMVLLLHLACPYALTRTQFGAALRWLARWREQAKILREPDAVPKARAHEINLTQDRPFAEPADAGGSRRWLSLGSVLRKMRQRLEGLAAGESPESLKLGGGLSGEACVALLNTLSGRLKHPWQHAAESADGPVPLCVGAGLENIHHLLGGPSLKDPFATATFGNKLSADQIAVFGHVVRDAESAGQSELWQAVARQAGTLHLRRPAAGGEARVVLNSLLAIKAAFDDTYVLATVASVCAPGSQAGGELLLSVRLFAGEPEALMAEVREKTAGKVSRQPAFRLPAEEGSGAATMIVPIGVPARALAIRFHDKSEKVVPDLQLAELIERGGDIERWTCTEA